MHSKSSYKNLNIQQGVSLVELAIVIVIIGLVMGVMVGGVNIQKASEMRSIITDIEQFEVAISGFEEKYRDLPGDMTDAHDYWGSDCDATALNCNGDGDGDIAIGSGSNSESYRFWQHLELAAYIEGGYSGTATGTASVPGVNVPATKRNDGGYQVQTRTNDTDTVEGLNIVVGGFLASNLPYNRLFTAAEAYSIDKKTDDGDADSGNTQSRSYHNGTGWQSTCLTGTDPNRTYVKTTTTPECIMFFEVE